MSSDHYHDPNRPGLYLCSNLRELLIHSNWKKKNPVRVQAMVAMTL
jgi:hypothetical protein